MEPKELRDQLLDMIVYSLKQEEELHKKIAMGLLAEDKCLVVFTAIGSPKDLASWSAALNMVVINGQD